MTRNKLEPLLFSEVKDIGEKIISEINKKNDELLDNYFEPFLRELGIEGGITKEKLDAKNISFKVIQELEYIEYHLLINGLRTVPPFRIAFNNTFYI